MSVQIRAASSIEISNFQMAASSPNFSYSCVSSASCWTAIWNRRRMNHDTGGSETTHSGIFWVLEECIGVQLGGIKATVGVFDLKLAPGRLILLLIPKFSSLPLCKS